MDASKPTYPSGCHVLNGGLFGFGGILLLEEIANLLPHKGKAGSITQLILLTDSTTDKTVYPTKLSDVQPSELLFWRCSFSGGIKGPYR